MHDGLSVLTDNWDFLFIVKYIWTRNTRSVEIWCFIEIKGYESDLNINSGQFFNNLGNNMRSRFLKLYFFSRLHFHFQTTRVSMNKNKFKDF